MSAPPTPHSAQRPPKIMSSRLMTMKFMQRAAASSATPTTPPPASSPQPPSSKRQKLNPSAPTTPTTLSDLHAIRSALAAEEAKRLEALARRHGEEAGETKWVLSVREEERDVDGGGGLKVRGVGYVEIDKGRGGGAEEEGEQPWRGAMVGRRSFGRFNRALEKQHNPRADSSSSSDSSNGGSNEDEDGEKNGENDSADSNDDPSSTIGLIREAKLEAKQESKSRHREKRKKAKKAKKAELVRLAEVRKSKEVNLNKLTSISGGGGGGGTNSLANKECHNCGKKGHVKRNCPERASKRPRMSE